MHPQPNLPPSTHVAPKRPSPPLLPPTSARPLWPSAATSSPRLRPSRVLPASSATRHHHRCAHHPPCTAHVSNLRTAPRHHTCVSNMSWPHARPAHLPHASTRATAPLPPSPLPPSSPLLICLRPSCSRIWITWLACLSSDRTLHRQCTWLRPACTHGPRRFLTNALPALRAPSEQCPRRRSASPMGMSRRRSALANTLKTRPWALFRRASRAHGARRTLAAPPMSHSLSTLLLLSSALLSLPPASRLRVVHRRHRPCPRRALPRRRLSRAPIKRC